jgi:Tfp pilus assembly protein PilP
MTKAMRSLSIVIGIAMLAIAAPVHAQAKKADKKADTKAAAEAPAATTTAQPPAKKADLPAPPPNFEYSPQGRRDPFISLVNRGKETSPVTGLATAKRPEGVPGMLTAELTVRGIMQTRGTWVAMVAGPDNKVYTVRAGDKLFDGVVRQVNATSVVILQEVNDPLSLEKQREVRKFLRGGDEVK